MSRWYAVSCQSRMEHWARSNLWERGFEVYLPLYLKRRRHARRVDLVERPLFPGYLFVRADLGNGDRCRVDTARGVRALVRFGDHVPAVADEVIAEIRSREGSDGRIDLDDPMRLHPGEPVRVIGGPLCERVGLIVGCADDRQRVIILLDLLGRQVRARVSADQLTGEL